MLLRQLFDQESHTYTYLVADTDTGEAALIDSVLEKTDEYINLLDQLELQLKFSLDTHTHADHVSAMGKLRELTQCETMLGVQAVADCVDKKFRDNQVLSLGKIKIKIIYTPGHTDDSYSFYVQDGKHSYVFTGDTLLIGGTGRTDFQNGDALAQYHSLTEKLLKLPLDTVVFPGHDYNGRTQSTLADEQRDNPRLQVQSAEQYAELMSGLKLPNPKLMDIAVPANQQCGKR